MLKRIVKNAFPTTCNELFWSIGTSLYVAAFSRIGTTSYASFQAAQSINSIFSFAAFSIGDATLILVGEKLGEGDKEYAYALGKKLLKIGTIFGVLFGLLVVAFAYPMIHLFALSATGKAYGFKILLVYGLTMGLNLYDGINITGILRGGGDTRFAMTAKFHFCCRCKVTDVEFSVTKISYESGFRVSQLCRCFYHCFVSWETLSVRKQYDSCRVASESGFGKSIYDQKFHINKPPM